MQIQCQHPVDARLCDQIGHQFGRNRRARLGAAILSCIPEIGNYGGDAVSGGPAQRIGDDQQFHQIVIGGVGGGLDDIHILAAYVFVNLDKNFLVVEPFHPRLDQPDLHPPVHGHASCDPLSQAHICGPRDQFRLGNGGHAAVP